MWEPVVFPLSQNTKVTREITSLNFPNSLEVRWQKLANNKVTLQAAGYHKVVTASQLRNRKTRMHAYRLRNKHTSNKEKNTQRIKCLKQTALQIE